MALRAVPDHPKFAELKAILHQPKGAVLGWLEAVWHFTGRFTPQGNIGKYSDTAIESWVEWDGIPGALIASLLQAGWIDVDPVHRLLVHDWDAHADKATKNALGRAKLPFCTPGVRTEMHGVRTAEQESGTVSRLPVPVPEPVPEPEAKDSPSARATPAEEPTEKTRERIAADVAAERGIWEKPGGGEGLIAAVWLFEELGVASSHSDRLQVAQVIAFEARDKGDCEASAKFLLTEAQQAMKRGEIVNAFWFKDRKFSPEVQAKAAGGSNGENKPSPTRQRVDRNLGAIAKTLERRGIHGVGIAGGTNGRALPEPRSGTGGGGVHDGLRAVGAEIFTPTSPVSTAGASNPPRAEILPPAR